MTVTNPQQILVLNAISAVGLQRFPELQYQVGKVVAQPDAILVRSQDMHQMEIAPSVKVVGRAGAGTNNIPVAALTQRGVPVFNTPGANANAVKELVLVGLLMAARNVLPAVRFVDALVGDDQSLHEQVESGKKNFAGNELPGRTLGVIGLGKVGSLVADAAIKLGMDVLGYDPEITVDAAWSLPAQVRRAHSVEEVLRGSDFIALHVPLLPATRHLIDAARAELFKPGAVLLNFSREGIADNAALLAALSAQRLRAYVCDFPAAVLQGHPQVLALPHLGASTAEAEDNCAVMVVDQVRDFLENGNIQNAVNFPNVVMPRESGYRLAVTHGNVPNMVAQISSAVARAGLNIHNMLNKSRGEIAYTLVDVESAATSTLIAELGAIAGVLAVRDLPPNLAVSFNR